MKGVWKAIAYFIMYFPICRDIGKNVNRNLKSKHFLWIS